MTANAETAARRELRLSGLLRPAEPVALPPRVRDVLMSEDRRSEVLVGYVQLCVGLLLTSLYIVSPAPADAARSMFAPVPMALAALLAFSVLRLWVIHRGSVPDWFVALSICADVGLLIALIWSFHIQYDQPPAFALKAPTFVYLFVFVVLRSLRFNPRYVLVAGLAAAFGWALITAAALVVSQTGTVTRSFSDYILGNRILIGAELDKILALLLVTGLLTLSARQAQRTLSAAVREESAVREIGRFLSRGVADQIAASETLIEAGHVSEREAAIMMIDIRGFTRLASEMPARDVVRILTSFHALIIPIVRGHGGVIDKFLGDGIMATFGAARPAEAAAADAMRSLEAVIEACEAWEQGLGDRGITAALRVNAAVAAGPVVFATLGDGDRLEYTVIGEAVNLAAKLEKHNKVERSRAIVSAATFLLAMRQGYRVLVEPVPRRGALVAGVAEPIDLYAWLA